VATLLADERVDAVEAASEAVVELAAEFVIVAGAGRDGLVQGGELLGVGERAAR